MSDSSSQGQPGPTTTTAITDAVRDEHAAFLRELGDPGDLMTRVQDRFDRYPIPPNRTDAAVQVVLQHLDAGSPLSMLRLGDGEGALLAVDDPRHPTLARNALAHKSVTQWGEPTTALEYGEALRSQMLSAIAGAEVLGIPKTLRIRYTLRNLPGKRYLLGSWGLLQVYVNLDEHHEELHLESKLACDAECARELLPHLAGLVRGRHIGLISCHDTLPAAMQDRMGAESVEYHPVPGRFRDKGGKQKPTGHMPERYLELIEELRSIDPGTLYLVGAGWLGKIYCEHIRQAGGIAIDIGSSLDVLAGAKFRKNITDELLDEWQITDTRR